jgi:hypothetical protein
MASIDFTVPTVTFRVLFVFIVLSHARRRVVHFGVTEHPTQEWTVQQIREAFPWDQAPRYDPLSAKVPQVSYKQDDRAADDSTQAHTDHQHSILTKEALNRERNLDEEVQHEHGEG